MIVKNLFNIFSIIYVEKGKPIERWGRKAAGLKSSYMDHDSRVANTFSISY